jgi:hypothetical protein
MADQSDVETALVGLVLAAVYPNGTAAPSVCNADCRIYRGWPLPATLDADLASGVVNVTILPVNGTLQNTTRFPYVWQVPPGQAPTLTATVAGQTVTFAGTPQLGQLAGVIVNGNSYVYTVQTGDDADLVAANMAVLIRANFVANYSGATVTVPTATRLIGRVVAGSEATREVRRQRQDFRITCWCPDYATRDSIAVAIDVSLSQIAFIYLPDGTSARLIFRNGATMDRAEDAGLYRRDLIYSIEYATITTENQPAMLFGGGTVDAVTPYLG